MTTVLIVDDSAFMRYRCVALIHSLRHETIEASDGREAIESYMEHRPDVVLMDITMPHVDGLAALRAIKAFDPNAKIAMVTAIDQQQVAMHAIKAGAKSIVVKPYNPDQIQATVQRLALAG